MTQIHLKSLVKLPNNFIEYGTNGVSASFLRMKYFDKPEGNTNETSQSFEPIHEPLKAQCNFNLANF